MKFGDFQGEKHMRHDVFLHKELCKFIPSPMWIKAFPIVVGWKGDAANSMIPSNEFDRWMRERDIDYLVHCSFGDGCSIYLFHPFEQDLALLKLAWDNALLRC